MIRKVSFRVNGEGEWRLGVIHNFTNGNAVVEDYETGDIYLVAVSPANLKYECKMDEWVRLQHEAQQRQYEAQQRAMAQQVVAVPNTNFRR